MRLLRLARREAEADRAALDARLLAVLEQMPTAVLVVDAVRRSAVYANQGTTALMAQLAAHAATPRGAALLGTRMETLHPDLAKVGALLADPGRLPHFGRLAFGPETADFVISPVGETGRTVAFTLTWWLSTAQGRVAERFEIEVKTVVERLLGTAGELSASSAEVTATIEATRRETGAVSEAADQLAAAIREICAGLGRASLVSDKAVGEAQASDARIGSLAQSAGRSATSSGSSTRSPTARTCWRSTPRSRPRGPAPPAGASPWWPGGEDARRPDRQGHRRHRRPGDRDPGRQRRGRDRDRRHRPGDRGDPGILASISAATEEQSAATRDTSLRVARVSELAARSDAAATALSAAARRVDEAGGALRAGVDRFLEDARRL
jgi:hypothetical protein